MDLKHLHTDDFHMREEVQIKQRTLWPNLWDWLSTDVNYKPEPQDGGKVVITEKYTSWLIKLNLAVSFVYLGMTEFVG